MGLVEIGAVASGLLAVVTLTNKIIKLITTIQSLIQRLDQLQTDMTTMQELWEKTNEKYEDLDQRLRQIEYELAIV